jgi:uncharacterized protein (TIGR02588 family)
MNLPSKNLLEWAVFGISVVLVLAAVSMLSIEAITLGNNPPLLQVEPGAAEASADVLFVPLTITNTGDTAAEQVELAITVRQADGSEEEVTLHIELLPRMASEEHMIQLRPSAGAVESVSWEVVGYQLP